MFLRFIVSLERVGALAATAHDGWKDRANGDKRGQECLLHGCAPFGDAVGETGAEAKPRSTGFCVGEFRSALIAHA